MAPADPNPTITVRLGKEIGPEIHRLARRLGKSPGDFLRESAAAIAEMIAADRDVLPALVQVGRALRQRGVGFDSPAVGFNASGEGHPPGPPEDRPGH